MKKTFTTSIEEKTLGDFREKCKENSLKLNVVIEKLMQLYLDEYVELKMQIIKEK